MTRDEAFKEIDEAITDWGRHCLRDHHCEHNACFWRVAIERDVGDVLREYEESIRADARESELMALAENNV